MTSDTLLLDLVQQLLNYIIKILCDSLQVAKGLDNLLDGGIEAGVITQVYGGPGVGKTQFCFTLCAMLLSHYSAFYIDTESSFRGASILYIANTTTTKITSY